jgi:rhodanese-related sulfurtransferase
MNLACQEGTMSANPFQQPELVTGNTGLCGTHRPGSYRELTPHEFYARKDMGVVVLKAAAAAPEFSGFRKVFALGCSSEIDSALTAWPRETALGLVCPDGTCSSRLAIRLSRQGYTVFHLAGGLREWQQCRLP